MNKLWLLTVSVFMAFQLNAVTKISTINGNWGTGSTWVGGVAPLATDTVIIATGDNVSTNGNQTCAGITITGTLTMASPDILTVNGDVSGGGTWSNGPSAVRTISLTGNWSFKGTSTGSGANVTFTGTGASTLSGKITTGTGGTSTLSIQKTGSGSVTLGSALTAVAFTLTTGTFDPGTFLLKATTPTFTAGTLIVGATTWAGNYSFAVTEPAGGTINYDRAGNQTVNNITYPGSLTLSGSGTKTLGTTTRSITGTLTLSGSATAATVVGLTIGNLVVGDGTTFTAKGFALTVNGTTTVGAGTSGKLAISSATGTKQFTGLVTISAGATWSNSGNSAINFRGGITNNGTFTCGSGSQTFTNNAQALNGTLSIPRATITTIILTNNGTLTVSTTLAGTGTLTNAATGTLNFGGSSITPTLTATAVGNTVNYTGSGQTLKVTPYHHLTLSGGAETFGAILTVAGNLTLSGIATATTGANLSIGGNLSIGDGTIFTIGAFNITVTGTTNVGASTSGRLAISSSTGTKQFTGLVTISAGAIWNNSGNSAINFRGGINNNGTFTAGTGIQTFDTNPQSLTGTLSIPNAIVTTITLTNNGTLTVTTALAGTGGVTQGTTGILNIGGTSGITTITATAVGNTINYNGAAQTVYTTTYYNLSLSGSGAKTAGGSFTVNGTLNLSVANPSATVGLLVMGANTLTMGGSATTIGIGDVTGIITRTSLAADISYTFGNQYTIINLRVGGTLPSSISMKIAIGAAPTWKTDAVQRTYDIIMPSASGFLTLNLHYLAGELNSNTATSVVLWDCVSPFTPGTGEEHGRSNYDLVNQWVGVSGLPLSLFPAAFSSYTWTLGTTLFPGISWNGSQSTSWLNAQNWTPVSVPATDANILIPGSLTNYPTLSADLSVGTLTLNSGASLSAGTYTITISGSVGAWINIGGTFNPGTGTVIFTNAAATISGATQFYNVTINSGASLGIGTGSLMQIAGTITNSGTWRVAQLECTIEYSGGAQTVVNPNGAPPGYYNLILSGSGLKTFSGTVVVNDTLSMEGTATASAAPNYGASAVLQYKGSSSQTTGPEFPATAPSLVIIANPNSTGVTLSGTKTIGALSIENSGIFNDGGFAITTATTLNLNSGTYNCSASTSPWGTANITAGTTVNYNSTGSQTIAAQNYSNLTISGARTSSNNVTLASSGTIGVSGTFNPTATFGTGTWVVTNSTVNFNGTGAQTVPAFNYNNLTISGTRTSSNNVTLASSGTIGVSGTFSPIATFGTGTWVVTSSTMDFNGTGAQTVPAFNYNNLTISGSRTSNNVTLASSGTIGVSGIFSPGASFSGGTWVVTGSNVNFIGTAQSVPAFTYNNLTLSGSGTSPLGGIATVGDTLSLTSGILDVGSNTLTFINGDTPIVRTSGTINIGVIGSLVFGTNGNTGGNDFTIPDGTFTSTPTISGLTINRTNSLTLGNQPITVNGSLTLTSGLIATGATNLLTLGNSASIIGGSSTSYVNGPLAYNYTSTGVKSAVFPIGKDLSYRPVTLSLTESAATSTTYTAEVIDSALVVNTVPGTLDWVSGVRYYTISENGGGSAFTSGSVTIYYDSDDLVSDTANLRIAQGPASGGGLWVDLGGTGSANITGNITAAITDLTTNTIFTLANATGGGNDLPIELSSFTSIVNGRDVNLNWETKTEQNSNSFVIERAKTDGNVTNLNWTNVQSVKAMFSSNVPKHYTYADKNMQTGKYQYRLKMVDNDGSFKYSKVIEAEIALPKDFGLSQNYPNPFNPSTKINYSIPNDSRVTLEVFNLIGERVAQIVNEQQAAGYYTVNFGSSSIINIASGMYVYRLTVVDNTGKNFSSVKKMMLLK